MKTIKQINNRNLNEENKSCSTELQQTKSNKIKLVIEKYPYPKLFLTEFNYSNAFERYRKYNTHLKCLEHDFITLVDLKIAYNKRTAEFLIEAWLYNLNDYINTENKLTPNQITEIAKLFYDKAYYLNLPEIVLLFKKIRMGEYGKIYGSFCGIDFFNSLNHFLKDRIIAYNKLSSEKQIQKIQKEHPLTINGYFSQK